MAAPRYVDAVSALIYSRKREELFILSLKLGFDFAALGTIVNGCEDFAFRNVRIFDELFRVTIH
jgi:hypothetical protein